MSEKTNVLRYKYCEDEGLVSIFVGDTLITELSDENDNPDGVFSWFVNTYSKTNLALNYTGYIDWKEPETTPVVNVGAEKEFWVAVEVNSPKFDKPKVMTFLAQYQNRPYKNGDEDLYGDDALVNTDGEYVNSVGWVTCQSHYEFDNYYELITFNESYKLLGWAEYVPPAFSKSTNELTK